MKIYGKHIATFRKNHNNANTGLMDRTLEVYELKSGLKGVLFDSSTIGWRKESNIISVAKFRYEDCDATLYRVCEYFGGHFGKNEI